MTTIEEARSAAEIRLRQHVESESHVYLIMQKFEAYALAVLDEAWTYDQRHNHASVESGCCNYHDLRTRIQELGKEPVKAEGG